MGPFNFGKKTLLELIDAGYPESVAARIASGELPMDNASKMARQQQMFPDIVYHGSMQDITGEYVPKYADNLMYTTPDPQFASEWAGKGSMQTRVGELDAFDRYRPQKQKIYEELGNPEYGTPEYDEFNNRTKEIFGQEQNAFKTVYPLAVRAQNIFDPTAEGAFENVTESIFKEKLGVDKLDPATEDYLRKGAYLYFEDPEVIKRLDGLGYDSVRLAEDSGKPPNTLAMFDGSRNVRSLLSAAFDPEYSGSNILGASAGLGTAGLLGASMLTPDAAMAGEMEEAIASDLQESQRWQAGVDKANESLQSDDPEIRELARAWLDEAGLLSDDRQAVIDARAVEEPLAYDPFGQPIYPSSTDMLAGGANYAASAAEGLARDIGGSAVGIFSPEMGRSIKDARSIPMGTEAQEFASRVANPIINAGVGAAVNELSEPVFFGRGPSPMDGLIYAATKAEEAGEMIPEGLEPYTDRAGNAIVTAAYAIPALRALMKAAR